MAYIVMVCKLIAYLGIPTRLWPIGMPRKPIAYVAMACTFMAYIAMACKFMVYIGMACTLIAYIGMTCKLIPYIAMAYKPKVMAYTAMPICL